MVWMMGQGVPSASLITENRVEQLRHQRAMLPSSGRSTTWRRADGNFNFHKRTCTILHLWQNKKNPPCSRTCWRPTSQKTAFQKRIWTWGNTQSPIKKGWESWESLTGRSPSLKISKSHVDQSWETCSRWSCLSRSSGTQKPPEVPSNLHHSLFLYLLQSAGNKVCYG